MLDLKIGSVWGKPLLREVTPEEKDALLQLLSNRKSRYRWIAANEIGKYKIIEGIDPLIFALQDSHWMVRLHAAKALGRIGDIKAIEPLISSLNDECPYVQRRVIGALGLLKDERAIPLLLKKLQTDKEMRVYISGAFWHLMGHYTSFALQDAVCENKKRWNPNSNVNNMKQFTPFLSALLPFSFGLIQWIIIKALGKFGDERAVHNLKLIETNSQNNSALSTASYQAIGQIECRKYEKYLPEPLE